MVVEKIEVELPLQLVKKQGICWSGSQLNLYNLVFVEEFRSWPLFFSHHLSLGGSGSHQGVWSFVDGDCICGCFGCFW